MNINTVALTGNLTRDPEVRAVGETSVCDLGVAVNERQKKNGEWEDYASFFDVTVWGKQADACGQYLSKGSPVAVQGRLRQERWENDAGEKRNKVKVVASAVQFLSRKGDSQGEGVDEPSPASAETDAPADDSDGLPF